MTNQIIETKEKYCSLGNILIASTGHTIPAGCGLETQALKSTKLSDSKAQLADPQRSKEPRLRKSYFRVR